MLTLEDIPEWMKTYVSIMTDDACKTIKDVELMVENFPPYMSNMVVNLNIQTGLLQRLKDNNLLK